MPLDPVLLPNLVAIRQRAKALAMIDAIVCSDWESRYYSFNASWGVGEEMASMRNGSGDDWFLLFGAFGAGIKGLAHETTLAKDKTLLTEVRRQVPASFASFLNEPAFNWDWMSYCFWRSPQDQNWSRVQHHAPQLAQAEDGSEEYLSLLTEPPAAYVDFAKWYYEVELPVAAVEAVYNGAPLTPLLVSSLNATQTLEDVLSDATEIGYLISPTD
jgi:hypothetical protein